MAIALVGAALFASTGAQAQTPDSFEGEVEVTVGDSLVPSRRFAGGDRIETSGLLATDDTDVQPFDPAAFDDGTVILARSELEFDALAGSTLGGLENAPIVLTPPDTASDGGELNPDTLATLQAVENLEQIFLLGNQAAIGDDIAAELAEQFPEAEITRVGGINRFETAAQISSRVPAAENVIIARADLAVDALVAGSIAATGEFPILLTGQSGPLDPFAAAELERLDPERVLIAGGTGAIAEDTEADIQATLPDAEIQRVQGNNRFSTAVRFAQLGTDEFGFGTDHVNLARDDVAFDALALGPHAALDVNGPAPIVLTSVDNLPDETEEYFGGDDITPNEDLGGGIADCLFDSLDIAGGIAAVSDAVEQEARQVLSQAPGERCNIDLTPETATNLVGETHTVTATVTDNALDPAESGTVTFELDSDDQTGSDDDSVVILSDDEVEIDDDGEAEFSFTSTDAGSFTITATVTDNDGNVSRAMATKNFVFPGEQPSPSPSPSPSPTETTPPPPEDMADLEIFKTSEMDTVTVGENITFTIAVTNNGPDAATGVTVTDQVPSNATFVNSPEACTETGGVVTCEFGDVAVDATETLQLMFEADSAGQVVNTATVAGDQDDDDQANNSSTETVNVDNGTADLALRKTADQDTATAGDTVTFTIDVFNAGPDDAQDVIVTDVLPSNTTFESASPECTNNSNTVTCDLDVVAVNDTETVEIVVTADTTGEINNTAQVDSASSDPNGENDADTETAAVEPGDSDLAITKTANRDTVTAGDTITFTIDVFNDGPDMAVGTIVTDQLPANTTFVSASPECTNTTGTVTCDLGDVDENDTETVQIIVSADMPGQVENVAEVDTQSDDANQGNNSDTATVAVEQGTADLAVTKTADRDTVTEGDTITFTIDVFNDGPDVATNVLVTDELPANTTFEDASAECTNTAGTVTCNLGSVAENDTETVQIVVTADSAGQVDNVAEADTTSDDPDAANNADTATVAVDTSTA